MYRVEEPSDNVSPMALVQNNSTNAVSSINDNFFTASNAQLVTMPQMQEMDIKGILANGRRTTSSSKTVDSRLSLFGSGLALGASNKVNTECYESRMDENLVSAVVQMKKDDNATKVEINAENQKTNRHINDNITKVAIHKMDKTAEVEINKTNKFAELMKQISQNKTNVELKKEDGLTTRFEMQCSNQSQAIKSNEVIQKFSQGQQTKRVELAVEGENHRIDRIADAQVEMKRLEAEASKYHTDGMVQITKLECDNRIALENMRQQEEAVRRMEERNANLLRMQQQLDYLRVKNGMRASRN